METTENKTAILLKDRATTTKTMTFSYLNLSPDTIRKLSAAVALDGVYKVASDNNPDIIVQTSGETIEQLKTALPPNEHSELYNCVTFAEKQFTDCDFVRFTESTVPVAGFAVYDKDLNRMVQSYRYMACRHDGSCLSLHKLMLLCETDEQQAIDMLKTDRNYLTRHCIKNGQNTKDKYDVHTKTWTLII